MFNRFKTIAALLMVVIIVSFSAGCSLIPATTKASPGPDIIKQAWDIIQKNYVDPTHFNTENMTGAAIKGIIDALQDPYTTYLTPQEYKDAQSNFAGSYMGIGAVISVVSNNVTVVGVFPDSPAEKAGIMPGDIFETINGVSTAGMTAEDAASKIRGSSGTAVKLTILHQGATTPVELDVNLTRATVNVPSVHFEMRGSYAYIVISQFTERTDTELAPFISELKADNAKGIVLDLRDNPGGILDMVADVASHFITSGLVFQVRSRDGTISVQKVISGEATTDLPMVVLVDEFSASASEVLTGALQDHNRALIAGNVTYGKGSAGVMYQLSDGSGIYLMTERWLTPDGRLIEGKGITPDIELAQTGDDELNWAFDYLKNGLH